MLSTFLLTWTVWSALPSSRSANRAMAHGLPSAAAFSNASAASRSLSPSACAIARLSAPSNNLLLALCLCPGSNGIRIRAKCLISQHLRPSPGDRDSCARKQARHAKRPIPGRCSSKPAGTPPPPRWMGASYAYGLTRSPKRATVRRVRQAPLFFSMSRASMTVCLSPSSVSPSACAILRGATG